MMLPLLAVGVATQPITAAASGETRQISASGTAQFFNTPTGSDAIANPEIRAGGSESGGLPEGYAGTIADRSSSHGDGSQEGGSDNGGEPATNAAVLKSWQALNHRNQRLANGGNQFSVEPPDQGLCAGNGRVFESVNDVARVFDANGNPLTGVTDLNTFYGYAPAILRRAPAQPNVFGPFVTDPTCLYDSQTQRWFNVVLTLDVKSTNGHFTGTNHLDIAVSKTADPAGAWTVYRVNAENDGTNGQPNHHCSNGKGGFGPCFADYPHIGADANGFYVTTNEYSFFGPEFHGAQIYAFSKKALAAGASTVTMQQFDTHMFRTGENGFAIMPATSPSSGNGDQSEGRGVEYFLSSNAGAEATDPGNGSSAGRVSSEVLVWALGNTGSLNSGTPALSLSHSSVRVGNYAQPPAADQKPGSTPLADCINDTACGNFLIGASKPFGTESEYKLDSSDTRMMQVTYAAGKLWSALDTALTIGGKNKAGIEWFQIEPSMGDGAVSAELAKRGYLGLANNNLIYPAIGVNASGRGVMVYTVAGADHFPSAGYSSINGDHVGSVQIAAEGAGPADGFSGYKAFSGSGIAGVARPRWGDYGATAVVGSDVYGASEYIAQTCTLAQYEAAPFGSCGGTRTSLANWSTRITHFAIPDSDN